MKPLFKLLAQHPQDGDFGIEVEVEGLRLPHVDSDTWRTEEDRSLRGGLEYVANGAIPAAEVEVALTELGAEFKSSRSILDFSFRTSVHVHMNVQQLTFNQVANCIYTYLLLEDSLMNYCGEQRKGNRFCLRAADAEDLFDTFEALFRQGEAGLNRIPKNQARYSAINIEALTKYGSLEFRGMEGNMDIPRLSRWCKALLAIRNYACTNDTPMDIYNKFDATTPENFLYSVLGDLSEHFKFPGLDNSFKRSFSLSIELPFAYKQGAAKRAAEMIKIAKGKTVSGANIVGGFDEWVLGQRLEGALVRNEGFQ